MDKKVSVIVPTYNYKRYLGDCLDSLMCQSYKNIEIIVVDDGSEDNPKEVVDKYPSVIFIRKENGGLSSARNVGIKIATGEWIMCLDADDKLVPAGIEEHIKLIEDNKTIAQCALMEFGERHIMYAPNGATLESLLKNNTIFCNAMFHKSVWEETGGYDESELMRYGLEDWEFWIRCFGIGCHVKTSSFIALRYRVHGSNMTKMTTHPHWEELKAYIKNKNKHLYETN